MNNSGISCSGELALDFIDSSNVPIPVMLEVVKHIEVGLIDGQKGVVIRVIVRDGLLEQQGGFRLGNFAGSEILDNIGALFNCLLLAFG